MKTTLRGVELDVQPPGSVQYGNELRAHTLIKHKKDGNAFIDIVPFAGGSYFTPFGYAFHAWVLVPEEHEIERNYDLEDVSIGSVLSRSMVAITEAEFQQLAAALPEPASV